MSPAISTGNARKRLIVLLACVVAVITIALLAIPPKKEPVAVWFVRSTNELGEQKLVFQGTNGTPKLVYYVACVATGAVRQATIPSGLRLGYGLTSSVVDAQTSFYLTLNAPSNDLPYYVMWRFQKLRPAQTRWERSRLACFNFFRAHGMPRIAGRFLGLPPWQYIPSTEIKE